MRPSRFLLLLLAIAPLTAFAGGPLLVGGPAVGNRPPFGIDGQPFTWDPAAMPIQYRVDPGPLSVSPTGATVLDHATGIARLQQMFGIWQNVPTANVSFANAGAILPAGSYTGGDVNTATQFNDILGSCKSGAQSPIVFDADGKILTALGLPPEVIGITTWCALDTNQGHVRSALMMLNGEFQDGVNQPHNTPPNFELTANEFDEVYAHEMGHFIGLDHSQINLDMLVPSPQSPCNVDSLAGLPLMFPIEFCQARADAGLPTLSTDDVAWISTLYPKSNFSSSFGTVTGTIYFPDGISPFQGANVIARRVDDPSTPEDESRRIAVSAVSGYLFTNNPGQSFTATMVGSGEDNTNGSPDGSRNPKLIGYYQLTLPPGTYTIEVQSVYHSFTGGSSVGPMDPPVAIPGPDEFWNQYESAFDMPGARDTITVNAGQTVGGIDIILNGSATRFDQYEDSGALFDPPLARPFGLDAEVQS